MDRNRDPNRDRSIDRNRDGNRRYTSHYGDFGARPAGYRDFVSRNFNVNRNVNNFNQNPWQYGHGNYWNQNYGNDWGRSNWYRNFNRYGYANNFSPWWGVVPGLGWNWGGWGWGWGWPQWGWGYGNWGGYGYGYGDYSTYYGDAAPGQQLPMQQVEVMAPTPEQVQTAQDFYGDALAAFQQGQYQEAIRLCQHAMVDNPAQFGRHPVDGSVLVRGRRVRSGHRRRADGRAAFASGSVGYDREELRQLLSEYRGLHDAVASSGNGIANRDSAQSGVKPAVGLSLRFPGPSATGRGRTRHGD